MSKVSRVPGGIFAATALLILLTGCGGGEYSSSAPDADADASVGAEPTVIEISPEAVAILAQADLADGTEDHVVEQCASCGLGMQGHEENALTVGDYEMRFCSDTCSRRFEADAEALILKLPQP